MVYAKHSRAEADIQREVLHCGEGGGNGCAEKEERGELNRW